LISNSAPIAASSPLITLDGKNADKAPALITPNAICRTPPISTANRNASKLPSDAICAATIAVNPAAGPETLVCEPLNIPTTMPPTIPAISPENSGAPDASAIPKQSGRATRKTIRPAIRSRGMVVDNGRLRWAAEDDDMVLGRLGVPSDRMAKMELAGVNKDTGRETGRNDGGGMGATDFRRGTIN